MRLAVALHWCCDPGLQRKKNFSLCYILTFPELSSCMNLLNFDVHSIDIYRQVFASMIQWLEDQHFFGSN